MAMVSPDRAVVRLPILPTPPAGEGRQCKLKKLLEAAWLPPAADTGQGRGLLGVIYEAPLQSKGATYSGL